MPSLQSNDLLGTLQAVSELCSLKHFSDYAYAAPDSIFYHGIPLYISDIKISSDRSSTLKGVENPSTVPWDDDIKTLASDLMCVLKAGTFNSYLFLTTSQ